MVVAASGDAGFASAVTLERGDQGVIVQRGACYGLCASLC
ncbi:Unknown protein sequence [Pseudomonas amygdali pv. morsprunorum]|nr:Unknown protein sequence [Pseudomonas amygdali pv. morsprunorum]